MASCLFEREHLLAFCAIRRTFSLIAYIHSNDFFEGNYDGMRWDGMRERERARAKKTKLVEEKKKTTDKNSN